MPTIPSAKTRGDVLFEEYLQSAGITDFEFERTFRESVKKPDYSFVHDGRQLLLDVKDFRGEPNDFEDTSFGPYDPYGPIREKINEGSRKFKEFKSYPCALVLYNHDKPLVTLTPIMIYAAMLGNLAWSFPVNTATGVGDRSKEKTVFASGGKMIRYGRDKRPLKPQNTTISAVIVMGRLSVGQELCLASVREKEQKLGRKLAPDELFVAIQSCAGTAQDASRTELRVVVHENPYARVSWPRNLFRGQWDEHYGTTDEGYIRRQYAGQARLEWEKLTGKVADFSK